MPGTENPSDLQTHTNFDLFPISKATLWLPTRLLLLNVYGNGRGPKKLKSVRKFKRDRNQSITLKISH